MKADEKINLTKLNKIDKFHSVIHDLTVGNILSDDNKAYILSTALVLMNFYKKDKRHTSYIEFSYYIILKYSLQYQDYKPLYDFTVEFGFFPISKDLLTKKLVEIDKIKDVLIENTLDTYKINEGYIETFEQYHTKLNLLQNTSKEIIYNAPTSFGKSSIIVDLIRIKNYQNKKTAIIVPSKSLLMQTYKMIKTANFGVRLLIHDEMYSNDGSFIAIFTQERALRLLDNNEIFFDVMFIDEAHNIMNNNARSILLSRLIHKNQILNYDQKIIYLSPLIGDKDKLKINSTQEIKEEKIHFNIKEPEVYEYRLDGSAYQYNRFTNDFYLLDEYDNELDYILSNSKEKNFIYLRQPRKIEQLASLLAESLPLVEDDEITELIELLKENIHEKFYVVKLLKKGVVYLHGKIPDLIKEYLEYKFKKIKTVKYIVANSVILEGINLPVDNLFVLNTHALQAKELTNLIGRVNRLDSIFLTGENKLSKLLPTAHFVNNEYFNRQDSNMKNKIELLRSRIFEDKIDNPTLDSFEIDKLNKQDKAKAQLIIDNEDVIFNAATTDESKLKQYCISQNIHLYYKNFNNVNEELLARIKFINNNLDKWHELNVMKKLYTLFIKNISYLNDFEFERLKEEKARNYYDRHIVRSHRHTLKENIDDMLKYFKTSKNTEFYMGQSYGEFAKRTQSAKSGIFNVYVDLSSKDDTELVNLAIVKLQMEDTFVSYTLTKFIEMMYAYELISLNDYNLYIYGTEERKNIELMKFGLSGNLISRLESDGQLKNIAFDSNGNIQTNRNFNEFRSSINDFYKFEIDRFI